MRIEKLILTLGIFTALSLSACDFREEKLDPEPVDLGSFAALQQSVLGKACIRCHNPSSPAGGIDLTTYNAAISAPSLIVPGNADASLLYQVVFSGVMPPRGPRLSDVEVAEIRDWINNGANQGETPISPIQPDPNPQPPGGLPQPVIADFKYIYENIFEPKCLRCHGGEREEAFLDISDYNGLFNHIFHSNLLVPGDPEGSVLFQVLIEENPRLRMPAGGDPLTEAEVELIREWILNNAPEEI